MAGKNTPLINELLILASKNIQNIESSISVMSCWSGPRLSSYIMNVFKFLCLLNFCTFGTSPSVASSAAVIAECRMRWGDICFLIPAFSLWRTTILQIPSPLASVSAVGGVKCYKKRAIVQATSPLLQPIGSRLHCRRTQIDRLSLRTASLAKNPLSSCWVKISSVQLTDFVSPN